jgi:hypothetical protein
MIVILLVIIVLLVLERFYRDASGGSFLEVSAKPCGNKLVGNGFS